MWKQKLSNYTVEPRYNEVLGTMKITLLYQVSHYIRVKKQRNIKSWDQQNYLVIRGFCYISDLFITRFHCTILGAFSSPVPQKIGPSIRTMIFFFFQRAQKSMYTFVVNLKAHNICISQFHKLGAHFVTFLVSLLHMNPTCVYGS